MTQSKDILTSSENRPAALTAETIARWAEAVANGEAPFPSGLNDQDQERLVTYVQRRRRSRLVQFIARAIAQDILRSRGQQHGGNETC